MSRLRSYRHAGLTFDVRDEGPLAGEPLVLLHGFPQRASCWRRVVPLLHGPGLRTYALDQRGYSSGARPTRRWDYRMPRLVGDVLALVEAIGSPVHLVGHDWGAAVGWALAAQRPEKVRSLTAVSVPHPKGFTRALGTSAQALRSWYVAAFQVPFLPELVGGSRLAEEQLRRMGMDEESLALFRAEVVEDGALQGGLMWYRALPFAGRAATVGTVRVPTTFVWSGRDSAISRAGGEHTAAYVDAPYDYVELPDVSHWIPEEAPEALAEAVLARVGAAARA